MGTTAPNEPYFQVYAFTALLTQHEVEDILMYWVGSGGNVVNKNVQWAKQEYFTGHSGIRSLALTQQQDVLYPRIQCVTVLSSAFVSPWSFSYSMLSATLPASGSKQY